MIDYITRNEYDSDFDWHVSVLRELKNGFRLLDVRPQQQSQQPILHHTGIIDLLSGEEICNS
jgi:hypothetical protein